MHVLLFLAAGMFVGYLLRFRKNVLATARTAATWSLYLLIFFLGVSVGANPAVVRSLGRLGIQALILSAGGILGSVLVACLVSRTFFRLRCHEE
jgi:uncharacterized membrane protein YbjE (DUF340 family)